MRPEATTKKSDRFLCEKRRMTVSVDGCLTAQKPPGLAQPIPSCRVCEVGSAIAARLGDRSGSQGTKVVATAVPTRRALPVVPPDVPAEPVAMAGPLPLVPDLDAPSVPRVPRWRVDDDGGLAAGESALPRPAAAATLHPLTDTPAPNAELTPATAAVHRLQEAGFLDEALIIARTHRVTLDLVLGRKRHARVIAARRALVAFLRDRHCLSYKDIGEMLGRDSSGIRLLMLGTETAEGADCDTLASGLRTPTIPPGATLQ